jgi:hypothetical protein
MARKYNEDEERTNVGYARTGNFSLLKIKV